MPSLVHPRDYGCVPYCCVYTHVYPQTRTHIHTHTHTHIHMQRLNKHSTRTTSHAWSIVWCCEGTRSLHAGQLPRRVLALMHMCLGWTDASYHAIPMSPAPNPYTHTSLVLCPPCTYGYEAWVLRSWLAGTYTHTHAHAETH